ncbi:hypothetical protein ACFPU1_07050 [Thalassorhabdus alkalitolerans]|uniref:AhpC/TSA family protein n=1 Tax=Thalassorhabdus alkalitolerans TaxID=2282697 RepID=A0ABW0YJF4_9BACI|nr:MULTISPECIES: hypothetical protein [Bacillaceae]
MKKVYPRLLLAGLLALAVMMLAACGEEEEELALHDENYEEISLVNKEQPTVLFHFTGVG